MAPPQEVEEIKKKYRDGPSSKDVQERDRYRADLFRPEVNNPLVAKTTLKAWRTAGSAYFRQVEADRKRSEAIAAAYQVTPAQDQHLKRCDAVAQIWTGLKRHIANGDAPAFIEEALKFREPHLSPAPEAAELKAVLDANKPKKRKGRHVRSDCGSRKATESDLLLYQGALKNLKYDGLIQIELVQDRLVLRANSEQIEQDGLDFIKSILNGVGLGGLFETLIEPPAKPKKPDALKLGRPPKGKKRKKKVANLSSDDSADQGYKLLTAREKMEKYPPYPPHNPPKTEVRVVSREERIRRAQKTGWTCDIPKIRRHIPTCTPIAPPGAWYRSQLTLEHAASEFYAAPSMLVTRGSAAAPIS